MSSSQESPSTPRVRDQAASSVGVFRVDVLLVPADAAFVTDARAPQVGRWWVQTQTATYLVDLDHRSVTRFPAPSDGFDVVVDVVSQRHDEDGDDDDEGREGDADDQGWLVSCLRNDTKPIPLVQLRNLAVGEAMVLLLDIRGDGVLTVRPTTPVRRIVEDVADGLTNPAAGAPASAVGPVPTLVRKPPLMPVDCHRAGDEEGPS